MTFDPASADPAAMERIIRESGVDRRIAAPGWSGYAQAVVEALIERLAVLGPPLRDFLAAHTGLARVLAFAILAVVAVSAIVLVVRSWRPRAAAARPALAISFHPVRDGRNAAEWRAELERRLAAGELSPALEALWWWFALAATRSGAVPSSSTSRELVAQVGRPELTGHARDLDRLLYGPHRPQSADVRAMVVRLEEVLS